MIAQLCLLAIVLFIPSVLCKFTPDWPSLDNRPLPSWYDEAKFGIFMHWGVFSYVGMGDAWFVYYWKNSKRPDIVDYMNKNYSPKFTYAEFAEFFTADLFDPDYFAELVEQSGAKYYVLTSKHCEGFTNWPSKYSWNWNSQDVGPNRDIVGELATAFRKKAPDIKFGLYYSQLEWFDRLYIEALESNFSNTEYRDKVSLPQLYELINEYQPEILWSDAAPAPDTYWKSKEFLAWLYNDSPVKDTVVTNDRWGAGTSCTHGGYYSCNDRYNPGTLQNHKWENAMTVDSLSWGFRRTATVEEILTIQKLLRTFAETISCGGNMLMNVGPTHDGRIIPIFQERLLQMGQWLKVNGEAIYASKPWIFQNDTLNPDVWYTSKIDVSLASLSPQRLYNPQIGNVTVVYAILLKWPDSGKVSLASPRITEKTTITMLGYGGKLVGKPMKQGRSTGRGVIVDLSNVNWCKLPNTWAWVLKMEHLASDDRNPVIGNHGKE